MQGKAINIEHEQDAERLRWIALTLQTETKVLYRRISELTAEIAKLKGLDGPNLMLEIQMLEERLKAREQMLFGKSSEKRPAKKCSEAVAVTPEAENKHRHGHGPREQLALPVVEEVHRLDDADKICPKCGGELKEMCGQYEESEEIDVVERTFRIVRHKRQKYTCRCGSCVDTAIGPEKLIPGGRYSVNFAVAVATGKYADHLPLDRQVKQMVRAGLVIDGQTLWDQLWALYAHLLPTYEALHRYVLASPVIGADETRWPLLEKGKTATWWGWSVTCPDAVCYRILPSRSAEAAGQVLIDYGGVVIADGYSAYSALQKERRNKRDGPRFELAFCWAHVRRKFIECEEDYPQASDVLKLIGKLYEIEARVCEADVADRMAYLAELREKESAPVVREIHAFLLSQRPLPQSSFGKAVAYTLELWNGLVKFLKDPVIAIDNNATERTMRGMAVGRKNHYGSKSKRGTEVAALFYSLIESAKLAGLEPSAYLAEAARRAINNPGTVTLPQDLLKEQNLS